MHHPWRDLRERDHITVHWQAMPTGVQAASNGADRIWIDDRLLQVERRCSLTHELVHLEHGHNECQDDRTEALVRREAAERLIDTARLIDAAKWAHSPAEMAEELWVTEDVLRDRITGLSPVERAMIDYAILKARNHAD